MNGRPLKKHAGSNDEMIFASKSILKYLNRDIKEFNEYNYSKEYRKKFEDKINEYESLPDDQDVLEKISDVVIDKQVIKKEVFEIMKEFKSYVSKSEEISKRGKNIFNLSKVVSTTEKKLIEKASQIANYSKTKYNILNKYGLSEKRLNQLFDLISNYEVLYQKSNQLKKERTELAKKRNFILDELYTEMVFIATLGKNIWEDTDKDKYTNYVLRHYFERKKKQVAI